MNKDIHNNTISTPRVPRKGLEDIDLIDFSQQEWSKENIEALIKYRHLYDINIKDSKGYTALHYLASRAYYSSLYASYVHELINYGIDIDLRDEKLNTALHYAVAKGHKALVILLMHNHARLDWINEQGLLPWHIAILDNNISILELLLKRDDDSQHSKSYNIIDHYGYTPLHYAINYGHRDSMIEMLLSHNASVDIKNDYGKAPLHTAFSSYVNSYGYNIILKLIQYKGTTQKTLNAKDNSGNTVLHYIAKLESSLHGRKELIKALLKKGPNLTLKNNDGHTPLTIAIKEEDAELCLILIEKMFGENFNKSHHDISLENIIFESSTLQDVKYKVKLNDYISCIMYENSTDVYLVQDNEIYTPKQAKLAVKNNDLIIDLINLGFDSNKRVVLLSNLLAKMPKQHTLFDTHDPYGNNTLHVAVKNCYDPILISEMIRSIKIGNHDPFTPNKNQDNILHLAAKMSSKEVWKAICESSQDNCNIPLSQRNNDGSTPLHLLVELGRIDFFQYALGSYNSIDLSKMVNKDRQNVLNVAIQHGHLQIIELLVKTLDIKKLDDWMNRKDKSTPLHYAAAQANDKILQYLIPLTSDVNAGNNIGRTPLHYAATNHNTKIIKLLLEAPTICIDSKDNKSNTALHYASQHNMVDAAAMLLSKEAKINPFNKCDRTPFSLASTSKMWKLFMTHFKNKHQLMQEIAIYLKNGDNIDILELLINAAVSWDNTGLLWYSHLLPSSNATLLHAAVQNEIPTLLIHKIISYLMPEGSLGKKDDDGMTALHYAVEKGSISIVQTLVNELSYETLNATNSADGYTALHLAVKHHHVAISRILLDTHNVNYAIQDKQGNIPIHLALYDTKISLLELLVQYNIGLNYPDSNGNTALHLALLAEEPQDRIIKILLSVQEININEKNHDGHTPLFLAIKDAGKINMNIISLLLSSKANIYDMITIENNDEQPPHPISILEYANMYCDDKVCDLLALEWVEDTNTFDTPAYDTASVCPDLPSNLNSTIDLAGDNNYSIQG